MPETRQRVTEAIEWLEAHADGETLENMGPRYGIYTDRAIGVPMRHMKTIGKQLGVDHDLAIQLWDAGWYETRTVASLVDDPTLVTPGQMDSWAGDFDNWAIVDSVCFNLFDRAPKRWVKVDEWAGRDEEFVKRAAFALLWSLALHDRDSPDEHFAHGLTLIEREAGDGRPLVDKAIAMALRAIGKRRPALTGLALDVAQRLAEASDRATRSVGRPAVKELTK
jgi:3-methyladenine DNA glycosylase AlkD